MRVLVSGASGLIGTALRRELMSSGHEVIALVRRRSGPGEISWDPVAPLDPQALRDVEAVVHLAGKSIAGRWSEKFKQDVLSSRVQSTKTLTSAAAQSYALSGKPLTFICASAIGYYGNRGDELLTEESHAGSGVLAELTKSWEAATSPAREAGLRVANLRIGIVLAKQGGALKLMLPAFRMGVGGRIGDGRQYMSWISLDDVTQAIVFALQNDRLHGPINVVGPQPVRNADFVRILGRELHRPTVVPLPVFAVRLLFGEMGNEMLLGSQRVLPHKLLAAGYQFRHSDLKSALRPTLD